MQTNDPKPQEKPLIERIMALKDASLEAIKAEYSALFGQESPSSNNKALLWRKIAYRLQELEYGSLPVETQGKINDLIQKYDPINNQALRPENPLPVAGRKKNTSRDRRLPIPGAIITKEYKGRNLEVKVLEKGFEYEGQQYRTLSAVAKAVTGDHWNGYLFFRP